MTERGEGQIERGIPNGWFAVSFSKDLEVGEVKRIYYFGKELVLFRTRTGKAVVLDAYCPHLGAHLAEGGRVMGETIRCPFHGWQYGTDGVCSLIPYSDRIPPKARVHSWEVCERNQMIMVWHHAERQPPSWEVPMIEDLGTEGWTTARTFDIEVAVHMQDMAENNCDPHHFLYVHDDMTCTGTEVTFGEDGRFMRVTSDHHNSTPWGEFDVKLNRDTWGLGLSSVRLVGFGEASLLMFSSTSPVDEGHTHSRWLFTATHDLADTAGEQFIANLSTGVLEDYRIWENKVHQTHPVLCDGDTHLAEFRRWVEQFYSDPDATTDTDAAEKGLRLA